MKYRNISSEAAEISRLAATNSEGQPASIVTYHEVLPSQEVSLYGVTTQQFRQHVEYLAQRREKVGESKATLITFDDGHRSTYEHALPVLSQFRFRAIFFVTVEWTGSRADYMSWSQLRELVKLGHSVQSHSWSHKLLTQLSDQDLEFELCASKETLEQKLGQAVDSISIPAGRWDSRVLQGCARAGYKQTFVSEPWVHTTGTHVEVLGRLMVRRDTTVKRLELICDRSNTLFLWLRTQDQFKRSARRLMGDYGYQHLWRIFAGRATR